MSAHHGLETGKLVDPISEADHLRILPGLSGLTRLRMRPDCH